MKHPAKKSARPLTDWSMTGLFPPEQFQFHPLLADCNKRLQKFLRAFLQAISYSLT